MGYAFITNNNTEQYDILPISKGGTGKNSFIPNQLFYASENGELVQLSPPTQNKALLRQDQNGDLYWSSVEDLASELQIHPDEFNHKITITATSSGITGTSGFGNITLPYAVKIGYITTPGGSLPIVIGRTESYTADAIHNLGRQGEFKGFYRHTYRVDIKFISELTWNISIKLISSEFESNSFSYGAEPKQEVLTIHTYR